MSEPTQDEPKIEWLRETIGIDDRGHVVFKLGDNIYFTATPERYVQAVRDEFGLKFEIDILERKVNAREPALWVEDAALELEKRGNEASGMRTDSQAGKIMWGQAQAYRDAAALIRSYVKP